MIKKHPTIRVWRLSGDLGAGKTTVVRAVARFFGVTRPVTSPTYTLRSAYPLLKQRWALLVHVDAYRIRHQQEHEATGILEDLANPTTLVFVEWPERLQGIRWPKSATLRINIVPTGRTLTLSLPATAPVRGQPHRRQSSSGRRGK